MRLVHLSDLHLGFRAFSRTERGWNLRERDLAASFRWALQEIVRIGPELVLVTGDIFDHPDPPSTAFLTLHRSLALLHARLPRTSILMIAGERDTPINPAEPGPVAVLDTLPGVEAAAGAPRAVRFGASGVHALLIPYRATTRPPFPELKPDPDARWNILLIRGDLNRAASDISLDLGEWSYVAVGGSHRPVSPAPNLWLAGAVERPGEDPWSGATEERGFVSFDLDAGVGEFHPVPGRPVVDLAPVRVAVGDVGPGTRRLRELVEGIPGGIDGKIVRVRLVGDVLAGAEGVSEGLLAAVRARASHLEVRLSGNGLGPLRSPVHAGGPRKEGPMTWRPGTLRVNRLPDPEARVIALRPGLLLLTAESEVLRTALAEELRGSVGDRVERNESYGLEFEPAVPGDIEQLWAGDSNPIRQLVTAWMRRGQDKGVVSSQSDPPIDAAEAELVERERALRDLRADAIEASGDLEVQTLAWARERQNAESHLLAFRERAQELRERLRSLESEGNPAPCPTCGRVLGEQYEGMLRTLKDEWEAVVQDGRWWRKRREQLDDKPPEIQKLEQAALRVHAEVAATAEDLEGLRTRLRHMSAQKQPGAFPSQDPGRGPNPMGVADPGEPWSREILRTVADLLARFTENRISGVRLTESGLDVVNWGGNSGPAIGADRIALDLAVHIATWQWSRHGGGGSDGLLLWRLHESGTEGLALRVVSAAAEIASSEAVILAVVPPAVLERMPDECREGLIFGMDERNRPVLRRVRGGRASLGLLSSGE